MQGEEPVNPALYPFICYLIGSVFFTLGTVISMLQVLK